MKKQVKRILCTSLVLAIILSCVPFSFRASATFSDVPSTSYFGKAVNFLCNNGITNGVNSSTFNPSGSLERAMAVTMLYRVAGEPYVKIASKFSDIDSGAYFFNAVRWASYHNITNGITASEFGPHLYLTNEQAITLLYRFVEKYVGRHKSAGVSNDIPSQYRSQWASWSQPAAKWAYANGILSKTTDILKPSVYCTRAYFSLMIYNTFMKVGDRRIITNYSDTAHMRSATNYNVSYYSNLLSSVSTFKSDIKAICSNATCLDLYCIWVCSNKAGSLGIKCTTGKDLEPDDIYDVISKYSDTNAKFITVVDAPQAYQFKEFLSYRGKDVITTTNNERTADYTPLLLASISAYSDDNKDKYLQIYEVCKYAKANGIPLLYYSSRLMYSAFFA